MRIKIFNEHNSSKDQDCSFNGANYQLPVLLLCLLNNWDHKKRNEYDHFLVWPGIVQMMSFGGKNSNNTPQTSEFEYFRMGGHLIALLKWLKYTTINV